MGTAASELQDSNAVEVVAAKEQSPAVPGSLTDLASRLDEGVDIVKARALILETARKAAIRMTSPEDWVLFKDKQGRTVGYLQDAGCDRLRDVFGISIFDVAKPEKLMQADSSFMYVVSGSGRCALTGQQVENVEGGRSSTDEYILKQKPVPTGVALELLVRKAARANLDGQIVRTLAGLQSVALDEINEAYKGDDAKTRARFREGRGFGSGADRDNVTAATTQGQQGDYITEGQRKRLYAIYKQSGWQDHEVKDLLNREYQIASAHEIPRDKYDEIIRHLESGSGGGSQKPS